MIRSLTEPAEVAEHLDGVDGAAVPAAVAELVLALVDGHVGAVLDALHHLQVDECRYIDT